MVSGDRAGARSLYLNVLNLDPDTPGILNITHLIYCTKDRFWRLLNPPHRKPWGMIYGLNFLRISYHHPSTPNVWMLRSQFLLVKFKIVCWFWFFVVNIHHFPWLNPALLLVVVGCSKSPISVECPTNVSQISLPVRNYGKSPSFMGKSTIHTSSMAIFNSFLYVYRAG